VREYRVPNKVLYFREPPENSLASGNRAVSRIGSGDGRATEPRKYSLATCDYCGNKSALSPVYAYSVLSTEAFALLAGVSSATGVIRF
jgi:hypothetical protein